MAKLTKVKLERASDAVFSILRESILDQTFLPGERLNVKAMAEKLEVSLTPVKDAINRLASEGLIELRPRAGTFVTKLAPKDLAETLAIRRALEWLAAETAVDHITDEVLEDLRKLVGILEQPVTTDRERQMHERKNLEFHQRLIELAGNRKMLEIYRGLNAHVKIARIHYTHEGWSKRLQDEAMEHRAILNALEARNVRNLQKALNDHIQRASEALVRDIAQKIKPEAE
jgi:GntR family transcriptional regulator, rspAB operon transcriptional repressor